MVADATLKDSGDHQSRLPPSKGGLNMLRTLQVVALAAFSFVIPRALAQQWLSQLPQKPQQELTFADYKQAFGDHYRQHPIDLRKDKLRPTFRFEGTQAIKDRIEVEEYKLFKRWEWLTEPRVYPSGRLDFEKIDAVRKEIESHDNRLVLKQREINPLKLRFELDRIIWPILKFWKPLGPLGCHWRHESGTHKFHSV